MAEALVALAYRRLYDHDDYDGYRQLCYQATRSAAAGGGQWERGGPT